MQITKEQLKQIIKEELKNLIQEDQDGQSTVQESSNTSKVTKENKS